MANAVHPAAVVGGWEVSVRWIDVFLKAISEALPDRVCAGGKSMQCHAGFGGFDPRPHKDAAAAIIASSRPWRAGTAAGVGKDGPDAVQTYSQNTENAPVEETELNYPVRIVRYELIADSDGPGKFRGGLGLRSDYAFPDHEPTFTILADRRKFAPQGSLRGWHGQTGELRPDRPRGRPEHPLGSKIDVHGPPRLDRHHANLRRRRLRPGRRTGAGASPARRDRRQGLGRAGARGLPGRDRLREPRGRPRGDPEIAEGTTVPASRVRLGVDIGGTFTDAIVLDEATGEFLIEKVPTTPSDLSVGFHDVTTRSLEAAGRVPEDIGSLVHGTTVATNCIIEGKTARCGLLTTEGFRDILEIARQIKPEPFNIFFEKPRPLVPRHRCLEASERLDAEGRVVRALDPESVRAAAETFRREGVEAVAVCFLHSYINPGHEQLAAEILGRELPGVPIVLSSEVCPAFREYLRASTTVVNAAIAPVVSTYLGRVEAKLRDLGLQGRLCVMQSNGGVCTFETARRMPVRIIESGPAAGVTVAAYIGSLTGRRNVISLDIGGTTAKAGLIQDGAPRVTHEFEVGAKAAGRLLHAKATGYPIQCGVVDLVEVGAGGGSIGWVDSGGALRVGPRSAGAEPGPACYGQGGTLPTLTDANLILGRLNPDFFLGGKMRLCRDAAVRAVNEHVAGPLSLTVTEAAFGMVEIANAHMIEALRLVSVQRGFDPREFALVAFGGAGPLHANAIARELDIPEVIIPLSPGVSSALGLLLADIRHDFVRTYIKT